MIDTLHPSEPVVLPARSFGRKARSVAGYSALTALMIVTPMLVFVPAALFHCAIRNGRRAAWATVAVAVAIACFNIAVVPENDAQAVNMAWSYVAAVALAVAVPSILVLPLIERGESFGRLVVLLVIGSALGLALTELAARTFLSFSPFEAQVAQAKQTSDQFVAIFTSRGMPATEIARAERVFAASTYVLPATMLIMVSLAFILSLLMFGRLNAWRQHAAPEQQNVPGAFLFRNFSLPDWLLFAFIIGGLTPLATGLLQKIAANTLTIVIFLYILQGLAIFRFLLAAMGAGFAGSMLGWLMLAFLTITGVGPFLLGVAGLFDPFFDFRRFKKRKDDSHESHSD